MASDITRLQSAYNSGALSEVARTTQKKENKETAAQDRTTVSEDSARFSKELSDPLVKPSLQKSRQSMGNFKNTLWETLLGNRPDAADEEQGQQKQVRDDASTVPSSRQGEARVSERSTPQFQPASAGTTVARDFSSTVQDFQKAQFENAGFIPERGAIASDAERQIQAAEGSEKPQGAPNPKEAPLNNNVPPPPNGNNAVDNGRQIQQQKMQMNQTMLQMTNQLMKMMEQMIVKKWK
jgi:hypothetical protein